MATFLAIYLYIWIYFSTPLCVGCLVCDYNAACRSVFLCSLQHSDNILNCIRYIANLLRVFFSYFFWLAMCVCVYSLYVIINRRVEWRKHLVVYKILARYCDAVRMIFVIIHQVQ